MQEPKVQYGTAYSADFEKLTRTFTMDGNYLVQGGRHVIMTESEYKKLLNMARIMTYTPNVATAIREAAITEYENEVENQRKRDECIGRYGA